MMSKARKNMGKVILICGKICSGKSYYAQKLSKTENAVVLSRSEPPPKKIILSKINYK